MPLVQSMSLPLRYMDAKVPCGSLVNQYLFFPGTSTTPTVAVHVSVS